MDLPEVQIVGGIVRVYSGSFHLSLRTHKIVRRKDIASLLTAKKKIYIYIYIVQKLKRISRAHDFIESSVTMHDE